MKTPTRGGEWVFPADAHPGSHRRGSLPGGCTGEGPEPSLLLLDRLLVVFRRTLVEKVKVPLVLPVPTLFVLCSSPVPL